MEREPVPEHEHERLRIFRRKVLGEVDQRDQYSDQNTKKVQRPDTQDAPQVKEAQVEFSAPFLFA